MSRKSQRRRGPAPRREPLPLEPAAAPRRSGAGRNPAVLIAAAVTAVAVLAVAVVLLVPRSSHPAASSPPIAAGGSGNPVNSSAGASAAVPGGPVADALIATLHAPDFAAHVEQSILASRLTAGARITLTAKSVADIAHGDLDLHSMTTGGGPATDEEIVVVGDKAWTRSKTAPAWQAHPRVEVARVIDAYLASIQVTDAAAQLGDAGVEVLDGRSVHHLISIGGIPYRSLTGVEDTYDGVDFWATADGVPVDMKATFALIQGPNSLTGSIEIRYSDVGAVKPIAAPSGAPSLAP